MSSKKDNSEIILDKATHEIVTKLFKVPEDRVSEVAHLFTDIDLPMKLTLLYLTKKNIKSKMTQEEEDNLIAELKDYSQSN